MAASSPTPSDWQELVHTMLPTIPIDKLWITQFFGGAHKGVDLQAKPVWENCNGEIETKGEGEPVCTPIKGRILRVDQEKEFLKDGKTRNPHAGRISGIIIAEVDAQGNSLENVRIIGLRHMAGLEKWRGKENTLVEAGTEIGTMGDIGSPGKVHLHFEIGTRIGLTKGTSLIDPAGSSWIDWWNNSVWSLPAWFDRLQPNWGIQCPPKLEEEEEEEEHYHRDPLVVNLDGNGIKTVGLDRGINFDHDSNGFSEATGWIAPGNGFLMIDKNGNYSLDDGSELLGDSTILPNGMRTANGFQALSYYDFNQDGKIDAQDPIWSQLSIWQYVESFEDVGLYEEVDDTDSGMSWIKMNTLDELGIRAIYLDSSIINRTDTSGNTEVRSGHFEWADGSTGAISEYQFQRDTSDTVAAVELEIPPDIMALPDLHGYGNVYDLHQAMARDSSGWLKTQVEAFVAEEDPAARATILDRIILIWTGAGRPGEWGKLEALEKFYGKSLMPHVRVAGTGSSVASPAGVGEASAVVSAAGGGAYYELPPWTAWDERAYHAVFEFYYGGLMAQTHLKELFDLVWCARCEETNSVKADLSLVAYELENRLSTNPDQGKLDLTEFARAIRGLQLQDSVDYLSFREEFIQRDPSLDWVIDTGGLPVHDYDHPGAFGHPHIFGTYNDDAIQGDPTRGDGYLNGLSGDDVIYGTDRNEYLYNESGNALLIGGGGDDRIFAGADNDILDGGAGNDVLMGEAGNDTYIFRRGSGQDTIIDVDATANNTDTIWLGGNLTPNDITLRRSGDNLLLKINDTTDTLTVKDFFKNDSALNRVEQIQFMDGTVWDESEIVRRGYAPTEGDDVIAGSPESDNLHGLGGNDVLFGRAGDDMLHGEEGNDKLYGGAGADTLDGGTGNDTLDGGEGNDTYLFGRGGGQDTITDQDATSGNMDTLALADGIVPADVKLERRGNDLKVTISDTGDTITVKNWLKEDTPTYGPEALTFADGTVWDTTTIQDMLLQGTDGNDVLYGFAKADTMQGLEGADQLFGRGGDDTLDGGTSNDPNLLPWARAASFRFRDRLACRRRRPAMKNENGVTRESWWSPRLMGVREAGRKYFFAMKRAF